MIRAHRVPSASRATMRHAGSANRNAPGRYTPWATGLHAEAASGG